MSKKEKIDKKEKKVKKVKKEKKEKKDKKDKKEKKEKKRTIEESNDLQPLNTPLTESTASINVSLDFNTSSSGWGSAFAAAALVQPEGLDNDFLKRTDTHTIDEGLSKISKLLPKDEPVAKKVKRQRKSDSNIEKPQTRESPSQEEEEDPVKPLEGRMVPHPNKHGQQIMILVNVDERIAFSALARTEDGDMIELGTVNTDRSISWRDDAFLKGTNIAVVRPTKLHVSKPTCLYPT